MSNPQTANGNFSELSLERISIAATLPVGFRHRPVQNPKLLAIFLHGYSDHGGSLLRRLFSDGSHVTHGDLEHVAILAPNGPFPVPVKNEDGWKKAYAWYFYDMETDQMIIPPDAAIGAIKKLVQENGYETLPKVIVGFSQGGFLAPALGQSLKNVHEIIGIGTGYRTDYYPANTNWVVSGFHGTEDEVISFEQAAEMHDRVLRQGFDGQFVAFPALKHTASSEIGEAVVKRIKHWLR
ncbi:MAG: hypothetical protein RBT63_05625 [Bdellovibrionales bacterium]|jgi:predicted esterase|nr:hypothetical protein [Bdellovibrionales bacterium]